MPQLHKNDIAQFQPQSVVTYLDDYRQGSGKRSASPEPIGINRHSSRLVYLKDCLKKNLLPNLKPMALFNSLYVGVTDDGMCLLVILEKRDYAESEKAYAFMSDFLKTLKDEEISIAMYVKHLGNSQLSELLPRNFVSI